MPNPTKRLSRSRRDKRRNHKGLSFPNPSPCPQCHEPKLPHHVCPNCGTYRGREYIVKEEE